MIVHKGLATDHPNAVVHLTAFAETCPTEVCAWFAIEPELRTVCNLFFGAFKDDRMYLDRQFLNLVQACEVYHRIRFSVEPNACRRKATLRARMNDLVTFANDVVSSLLPDDHAFINRVVDTRNYFVHHDGSFKDLVFRGKELFHVNQVLALVLKRCLLSELEFPPGKCAELLKRTMWYHQLPRQAVPPTSTTTPTLPA